jgi:hypothetical protein
MVLRNRTKTANRSGMSLAVVMMAAAMFALLVVAVTKFMENAAKSQTGISMRAQAQDFINQLRYSLAKPEVCKAIMDLTAADLVFTPATSASPEPVTLLLPKIVYAGQDLIPERVGGTGSATRLNGLDLFLRDALLIVGQNVAAGTSNDFTSNLVLALDVLNGKKRVTGSASHVIKIPISITAQRLDPTSTTDFRVRAVSCASASEDFRPMEACIKMGGRWLTGEYMKKWDATAGIFIDNSRCNFGGEMILSQTEMPGDPASTSASPAPDAIPYKGGTNQLGERVEQCFYTSGVNLATWTCPGRTGTVAGYRCYYNPSLRRWEVRYFLSGGAVHTAATQPWAICSRGVKISSKSPDTEPLDLDEPLSVAYVGDTTFGDEVTNDIRGAAMIPFSASEQVKLETVSRCKTHPEFDQYQNCNNPTDGGEAARKGAAGSCIYVRDTYITYGNRANLNKWKAGTCTSTGSTPCTFTGWMKVYGDYPRVIEQGAAATTGAPLRRTLEARYGWPCYSVEVNTAAGGALVPSTLHSAEPTDEMASGDKAISQCVHQWETYIYNPNYASYTKKARSTVYKCNNSTVFDPTDPKTLDTNTCWYLKDVNIANFFPYFAAPNAAWVSNGNLTGNARYTGWVLVQTGINDTQAGWFTFNTTDRTIEWKTGAGAANPSQRQTNFNFLPCTAGVLVQ